MHAALRTSDSQDRNGVQTRSCCGGFGLLQTLSSVLCIGRRFVGKGVVEVVQIVELIPMAPSRERSPDSIANCRSLIQIHGHSENGTTPAKLQDYRHQSAG